MAKKKPNTSPKKAQPEKALQTPEKAKRVAEVV